jgi:hypothetical protein
MDAHQLPKAILLALLLMLGASRGDILAAEESPPGKSPEPAPAAGEGPAPARPEVDPSAGAIEEGRPGPQEEEGVRWEFFSDKGRAFGPLLADPREAQIRAGYLYQISESGSFLDLGFGGDLGIVRASTREGMDLTLTGRGLMAPRFQFFSESFNLLNIDFIGGPALGVRSGRNSAEILAYHQSSHLGDDLQDRGERQSINYSFEALRLLLARRLDWGMRVYVGPSIKVRADPEALQWKVTLQGGAEQPFVLLGILAYAAVDVQAREEADWGRVNVSCQAGIELGNPLFIAKRQRLFVEFFNGSSNMGQFYRESECYVMVGGGFNF